MYDPNDKDFMKKFKKLTFKYAAADKEEDRKTVASFLKGKSEDEKKLALRRLEAALEDEDARGEQ